MNNKKVKHSTWQSLVFEISFKKVYIYLSNEKQIKFTQTVQQFVNTSFGQEALIFIAVIKLTVNLKIIYFTIMRFWHGSVSLQS